MTKIFTLLLCSCLYLFASSSEEIIKKVENNINGDTANMDVTMIVHTKSSKRTMKMKSISVGKEKSFIKILYPKKDKGITFLKIDHTMWQYVPKIERIIKIPASMMLQSWMGSDFSNDDLVRESSLSKDYYTKILNEDDKSYTLELLPKEDATVVWGKLIMQVSKKYYLPIVVKYYDEDNLLIRILNYKDVKQFDKRFYPTFWEMLPQTEDKKGHKTIMQINTAQFDEKIKDSYFSKNALKRYSTGHL
jgi:outer membrane lipoprotein-sorting protein